MVGGVAGHGAGGRSGHFCPPANKCDVVVHVASDRSLRLRTQDHGGHGHHRPARRQRPRSPGRRAARAPAHASPTPRSPRWTSTTSSTSSTRCARGADLRGRIVSVTAETAESATILIKPGRDWNGHVPGQYVRIGVDVDGVRLWRTYSLTHGPRADRCISLTVKAIPGGVVSNYLVHRAQAGEMLQLEQAEGEFVLPQPLPDKLLLVTAGSGITPVIGMLRNLFSRRTPVATDIVLVHVNVNESTAIFRDELRAHGDAGRITLIERYDETHGMLDVVPPGRPGARPRRAPRLRLRPGRPARRARAAPRRPRPGPHHRAVPHRPASRRARAARSPSPTAPRSTPTAPSRSSTSPRRPAS